MSRAPLRRALMHAAGSLRVLGLCALVLTVGLVVGVRQVQARVGEALFGFGDQLLRWEDARPHSEVRSMHLNGAQFRLLSMTVDQPVSETLDRFEADCERSGGLLADLDLSPTRFRKEEPGEGVLACFDIKGRKTADELMARVERFTESSDLSDIGSFRYVVARQSGEATTAVVLWTDGPVPLRKMFPKDADAPGRDPVGLPRMPGIRRLLSAEESNQPYSATLYSVPPGADPLGWYSQNLEKVGWSIRRTERAGVFFAFRSGRTVLVRLAEDSRSVGVLRLS